ncbi:nucleotidyl transferase AbiEii/AbiGii toxin family protein [bacterium]|nr:nucleotidyl transferase AbiEii/AbiGii toxin family protein [bacterium]
MLHTEVVERTTLELLKRLQQEEPLQAFCLAGGTSLALYLGHRISVDLDLFTPESFDTRGLEKFLGDHYGFRTSFSASNTLKGSIENVKIDCITHAYPYLVPPYQEEGVRLYGMEDIIAMKLSAIADDGSRMKDFIDIACLSTRFSFASMLGFYERKFPNANVVRPLKALTYFEDIDQNENVVMLKGRFSWKAIEKRLHDMAAHQEWVFEVMPVLG